MARDARRPVGARRRHQRRLARSARLAHYGLAGRTIVERGILVDAAGDATVALYRELLGRLPASMRARTKESDGEARQPTERRREFEGDAPDGRSASTGHAKLAAGAHSLLAAALLRFWALSQGIGCIPASTSRK
jgi:hypothetical protein